MVKSKFSLACYSIGALFLLLAFKLWIEKQELDSTAITYYSTKEAFDVTSVFDSEAWRWKAHQSEFTLLPDHVTALFIITSSTCSPCINEVIAYNRILNQADLSGRKIQQVVVITGKNPDELTRFVYTADFITPILFGTSVSDILPLRNFSDGIADRQLIFINNNSREIFFRVRLKQGVMTDHKYKAKVVKEAAASLKMLAVN